MATLQLILLLLAAVLVSSVADQLIPKVPTPLVQILMGILITLFANGNVTIGLKPDLFLVVFIAPLLFHEAQRADKSSLWANRRSMLSYAIGLVVLITFTVGFTVHALVPSIPLAAALALGAALGPTDPIAVGSVSKEAHIPERQNAILQGESLINDASGIVSFQFAIAAAITGTFSLASALATFAIEFFGGLALGLALGLLLNWIIRAMRNMGLDNITFHVLFEAFTPFIVYLFADTIHVSGVLAVVACGIVMSLSRPNLGPLTARFNIVSSSFWQVLVFALNGIVFVLLGTQLPNAIGNTWNDNGISNLDLAFYILVITLVLHGTRLVWSLANESIEDRLSKNKRKFKQRLRAAAITTLSGAKGTITLAIMFTLPLWVNNGLAISRFPNRDLLIFLASGVIVVTLLLATYVVPLLAPRTKEESDQAKQDIETNVEIMRAVIEDLDSHITPRNRMEISEVIRRYNDRIARIQNASDYLEEESDTELRIKVLQWEQEYVWERIEDGSVAPVDGYRMLSSLTRSESILRQDHLHTAAFIRRLKRGINAMRALWRRFKAKLPGPDKVTGPLIRQQLQVSALKFAIDKMRDEMGDSEIATESYSRLILEYQRSLRALHAKSPSITQITSREDAAEDVIKHALRMELEQIQIAYEEGRLSRPAAQQMRHNVYLMQLDLEDYL